MKIKHEEIRAEMEAWAAEGGQRAVALAVTDAAIAAGIRDVLPPVADERGAADERAVYNNRQQLFRWLRSDSRDSVEKISRLWPAIEAALPADRRARLTGDTLNYRASVANRECAEAINAAFLNGSNLVKEVREAITALQAMLPPDRPQRVNFRGTTNDHYQIY